MAASRREYLKDVFLEALELPESGRESFLVSTVSLTPAELAKIRQWLRSVDSAHQFFGALCDEIGSLTAVEQSFLPGDLLAGRFEIRRFLARGGMGEVYEAGDLEVKECVAIKVLRPHLARDTAFVERFRREIRLSRGITHPNVCRVHDVARHGEPGEAGVVLYSMELIEGETLAARLRVGGALNEAESVPIARQMIDGLAAAHAAGVLHRDLKPGNVMLCPQGEVLRVVLTDFGLAGTLEDGTWSDGAATIAYASPEQLQRGPQTPASDIFSLGVVLYEMRTGSLPFDGPSRQAPPVSPRQLNPAISRRWEAAILRCLETAPARRFSNAAEVAAALGLEGGRGVSRRAVIAGLAVLAAAGGGGFLMNRSRAADSPLSSVAILPFTVSGGEDGRWLAAVLSDRLMDMLTHVPGLRVSTTAGSRTPAKWLIRGSVDAAAQKPVLHLQLSEAGTGDVLWSETRQGDLLQLESFYRDAMVSLTSKMNLDQQAALLPQSGNTPTRDPVAWQKYLLARYYSQQRDDRSVEKSIELLEEALRLDPAFAAAHAWLGMCYWYRTAKNGEDESALFEKAAASAAQALALDETQADAHIVLGIYSEFRLWDWTAAERHFRRAVELRPSDATGRYRYSMMLSYRARHTEALWEARLAARLDLDSSPVRINLGVVLLQAGNADESIHVLEDAVAKDPAHFNIFVPLSCSYEEAGRLDDAMRAAHQAVVKSNGASFALSQEGHLHARMGRLAEARTAYANLQQRYHAGLADACEVSSVPAGWRDAPATLDWLERAVPARVTTLATLLVEPMYFFLHGKSRFQQLLKQIRLT